MTWTSARKGDGKDIEVVFFLSRLFVVVMMMMVRLLLLLLYARMDVDIICMYIFTVIWLPPIIIAIIVRDDENRTKSTKQGLFISHYHTNKVQRTSWWWRRRRQVANQTFCKRSSQRQRWQCLLSRLAMILDASSGMYGDCRTFLIFVVVLSSQGWMAEQLDWDNIGEHLYLMKAFYLFFIHANAFTHKWIMVPSCGINSNPRGDGHVPIHRQKKTVFIKNHGDCTVHVAPTKVAQLTLDANWSFTALAWSLSAQYRPVVALVTCCRVGPWDQIITIIINNNAALPSWRKEEKEILMQPALVSKWTKLLLLLLLLLL